MISVACERPFLFVSSLPILSLSLHNPSHTHNNTILIVILIILCDCTTYYTHKRFGGRSSASMATQYEKDISDICTLFEALQASIATVSRKVNRSAATTLKDNFRTGEGVIAEVRLGTSLLEKNTKRHMREDGEIPDSSDEEDDEGPVRSIRKPDQQYTDDPNRKGRLGEEEGVAFLQKLSPLIVSPSLLFERI